MWLQKNIVNAWLMIFFELLFIVFGFGFAVNIKLKLIQANQIVWIVLLFYLENTKKILGHRTTRWLASSTDYNYDMHE